MALTCSCGAELPDEARFCFRCGKPQRELEIEAEPEPVPVPFPSPAAKTAEPLPVHFGNPVALRVALLCGSLSALLNAIPFVSFGCCVWITGAGFLAAYLYSKRAGLMLSTAQGVRIGWMTGLLAYAITILLTAVNFALARSAGTNIQEVFRQSMEKMPAQDATTRQMIDFLTSPAGLTIFLLTYLALSFAAMISLAMAGGALGAKVLEKD